MTDAVRSVKHAEGHALAPSTGRFDDVWLGLTALAAAMAALPLAQSSWHGPEVSATLAVSAVALLAGQRWAIALVVIAELLLLPTVWPRAFFGGVELWPGRIAAIVSVLMIVPGLLSARRAVSALVTLTGWNRTQQTHRRLQIAFAALGIVTALLPVL